MPDRAEHDAWVDEITYHTFIHENFRKRIFDDFNYNAHPMGLLTSGGGRPVHQSLREAMRCNGPSAAWRVNPRAF